MYTLKNRYMKNRYTLKQFNLSIILSTGQLFQHQSIFNLKQFRKFLFVKADFFSNTTWKILDEPKIFITLVRFDRKYIKKQF